MNPSEPNEGPETIARDVPSGWVIEPQAEPAPDKQPEEELQHGEPEDELLIAYLAAGHTQVQAAAMVGRSDRTVRRRLQDPDFQERLHAAQAKRVAEERARLKASADRAQGVIDELLEPGVSDTVRLRAATLVLGRAERASDAETEARLARLEAHREEAEPWTNE